MHLKCVIACLSILLALFAKGQDMLLKSSDPTYPGRIILKIKPAYKSLCLEKGLLINSYNDVIQANNGKISKIFPFAKSPETEKNKWGNKLVDLTTIYEINFDSSVLLDRIISRFNSFPETDYCQLVYLPQLLYVPDDPGTTAQYYLNNIKAYQAWDLCKGDSTIIVGITDTGIENSHVDLFDNIDYNYNDPINSMDDDNDGYIDNFRGWDMGNNDNSPEWNDESGGNPHGIYVSGMAAARTDNGVGIASSGFHTKFLPVKINDSTGALVRAYEGIVYAADHGCSVINCSWGGQSPHPFGKDMIDYAIYNRNALVVAAAGNNGNTSNDVLYPAAFDNVLCVGASNQYDLKWVKSCYGPHVDVCAPGENVYLTYQNNGYTFGWGTSFASPIVATCAALIKSWYGDTLNALQLGEILRMSADNIDTMAGNIPFAGQLGGGRVNLLNALTLRNQTDSLPPSVRFIDYKLISQGGEYTKPGDTVIITGDYINYLFPSYHLNAELSVNNAHVHIIEPNNNLGQINTMEVKSNLSNPFTFYIDNLADYDMEVTFRIHFTDSFYNYNQYFKMTLNPSYADIDSNNIKLTIASNGKLGYNNRYPLQGNGFVYNNSETLLYEGGIAIAQSNQKITRSFRGINNYKILKGIHRIIPATPAEEKWSCEFSDTLAGYYKIGIRVKLDAMEWNTYDKKDFVFLNYTLYNTTLTDLNDLYFGLFCDWDVANSFRNKTDYISNSRLQYTWYTNQTNLYTGVKLLSNINSYHFAFDSLKTVDANGQVSVLGLTNSELFNALTTNKDAAGTLANGNDVANLISYGPFQLATNDSITLSFVMLASNTLYNLETSAEAAQFLYDSLYIKVFEIFAEDEEFVVFPNPADKEINIIYKSDKNTKADVVIINEAGKKVFSLNYYFKEGVNNVHINSPFVKGNYIIQLKLQKKVLARKLVFR